MTLVTPPQLAIALAGSSRAPAVVQAAQWDTDNAAYTRSAVARHIGELFADTGVQFEPFDVQVTAERVTAAWAPLVAVVPRWAPVTRMVEFRGGPAHGRVEERPDLAPVRVTQAGSLLIEHGQDEQQPVRGREVVYRLSMWTTTARLWIFVPDK